MLRFFLWAWLPLACCLMAPRILIISKANDYDRVDAFEGVINQLTKNMTIIQNKFNLLQAENQGIKAENERIKAEVDIYRKLADSLDETKYRENRPSNVARSSAKNFQALNMISSAASPVLEDLYESGKPARDGYRAKLRAKVPAERIQVDSDRVTLRQPNHFLMGATVSWSFAWKRPWLFALGSVTLFTMVAGLFATGRQLWTWGVQTMTRLRDCAAMTWQVARNATKRAPNLPPPPPPESSFIEKLFKTIQECCTKGK